MTTLDYLFKRIKIPRKQLLMETLLPRYAKSLVPNLTLSRKKEKVYLWKPGEAVWDQAEMEYWKAVLSTPQRDKHSLIIYCPYWTRVGLRYVSIRTSRF